MMWDKFSCDDGVSSIEVLLVIDQKLDSLLSLVAPLLTTFKCKDRRFKINLIKPDIWRSLIDLYEIFDLFRIIL